MQRLISITLLFLCPAALAGPADDVRCREIAFSQSVEEPDPDRFASFLDDDARFVGNTVFRGPAAITEAWSVFFAAGGPKIKWRPQFVEVLEQGGLALTRGPYRLITKDDAGNANESWGTFNSVWRLHPGGEWKVVFDAGSQASQAPADEVKALLDQEVSCTKGKDSGP